jgi:hypothetical protein
MKGDKMIRTLVSSGINWNWYLCANFNEQDKTAHVYYHDRWHKCEFRGSNHPKAEWTNFSLLEDDKRILYGIKVENIEYLVTNPDNVFNYRDFSTYVSE